MLEVIKQHRSTEVKITEPQQSKVGVPVFVSFIKGDQDLLSLCLWIGFRIFPFMYKNYNPFYTWGFVSFFSFSMHMHSCAWKWLWTAKMHTSFEHFPATLFDKPLHGGGVIIIKLNLFIFVWAVIKWT